jgi:hypothetical protein
MIRIAAFALAVSVSTSHAAGWEVPLASTASLRTGGARLVSSDVPSSELRESALISY